MLPRWSGLTERHVVTRRGPLGAWLGGAITRLNNGLFRSRLGGQANAILLRSDLEPLEHRSLRIDEDLREPRFCHAVKLEGLVVGNLHATSDIRHPEVPAADHPAADEARSGGIGTDGPGAGTGAHADVPGRGSGSGPGEEPGGSGGGGGSGGLPGGGVGVDDAVGGLNDVVKDTTDTVDDVVDGAADAVTGAVDGATDVVEGLLGGAGVSQLVDEPVEDLTDLLGGLLGS